MKIYYGSKISGKTSPVDVYFEDEVKGEAGILDPGPSQKIRNHSPDGFQWGYGGSGPSQLALALVLDLGVADWAAEVIYQRFKDEVVCTLPAKWRKTEHELRAVVERLLKEREK